MTKFLGVAAVLAAALAFASSASADQPLTGTVVLGMHTTFPAGTLCSFDVRVDLDGTGSFSIFDNPPRNIQHYQESGTVTANGKTLLVNDHWNVTTTPPSNPSEELGVLTQHGAELHILVPGGGIVLLDAGISSPCSRPGRLSSSTASFRLPSKVMCRRRALPWRRRTCRG
jgi:hypothetical protein